MRGVGFVVMGEVRIEDYKDFDLWLKNREQVDSITISSRIALRTLPRIAKIFGASEETKLLSIILPAFRATHAAAVTRWGILTTEAQDAAQNAANDADAAAHSHHSAAHSARSAGLSARSATDFASAASDFAALSATHFADFAETPSRSDPAAWAVIERDVIFRTKANNSASLAALPLWPDGPPGWATENWERLRTHLLAREDEDWGVWIDWYDGQLAGVEKAPINLALEEAVLLIPNDIWEAGPKVANAEIRRLMQLHARETLDEVVSPEPVIVEGKVSVAANVEADVPDDLTAILALPERLGEAVDDLLDLLALKANACPVAVPPLQRYRHHLDRYGPRPMLDSLNDRHAIVKDEYNGLRVDKFFDSERGLRRAFLTFFRLHKQFRSEFAKDAVREQAIRSYRLNRDTLDAPGLAESIDAFEQGAAMMAEAEVATPEFLDYVGELSEAMRAALRTPEPGPPLAAEPDDPLVEPIPNEKPWPVRYLLKGGAFAGRLLTLLEKPYATVGTTVGIAGFLASDAGAAFVAAVRNLWKLIFGI